MNLINKIKNLIKPDFKEWSEKYLKGVSYLVLKNAEKQGIKTDGNTFHIHTPDKTAFHLHVAYQNEIQTRMLVLATWVLAIGTLTLSLIMILKQS